MEIFTQIDLRPNWQTTVKLYASFGVSFEIDWLSENLVEINIGLTWRVIYRHIESVGIHMITEVFMGCC